MTVRNAAGLLLSSLLLAAAGCAGPAADPAAEARAAERPRDEPAAPRRSRRAERRPPSEEAVDPESLGLKRGEYALRVNDTLIVPMRWMRAERVAETIRPLLESAYGPGVRVVAHIESNHLLIHLPPRAVRQATPP